MHIFYGVVMFHEILKMFFLQKYKRDIFPQHKIKNRHH